MASTTALYTGLSGLNANARNLDVIGNNIANVNTTAYKSSRMLFSTQFARSFSAGTSPGAESGGTNPGQIGLGVTIAGTQRNFAGGSLSTTGDLRDLAIEGDGFFIVDRGGTPLYTRAGSFRQNAVNDLVTISGERLQGFAVDANFNIIPGNLVNLNVPVGTLTLAQATQNVEFAGNLNAAGNVPTQGSRIDLSAFTLVPVPVGPSPAPGDVLETNSLLIDIDDALNPGTPLFTAGQSIQVHDAHKGSSLIPDASLTITATTTVQDLMDFYRDALGINTTTGMNPDGFTPGVSLDPTTGVMTIVGNTGTVNDLMLDSTDLRFLNAAGTVLGTPFNPQQQTAADGESVRTTFVAFDSLGTPLSVDMTMVLDSKTNAGPRWRYYAESADDTDLTSVLGTGTIDFDTSGQVTPPATASLSIDRALTGALDPLVFDVKFSSQSANVTSLTDVNSSLAATFQDGSPLGTLASYSVGTDGVITGAFTNGLSRTVGQVALAKFANPEGLVDIGGNLFGAGSNSGTPVVTAPQQLGAGRTIGGALELSNVDLSQEFVNLILTSTGYSANSRVITTTDQLMQQLLALGR